MGGAAISYSRYHAVCNAAALTNAGRPYVISAVVNSTFSIGPCVERATQHPRPHFSTAKHPFVPHLVCYCKFLSL